MTEYQWSDNVATFRQPKLSDWQCYLFGNRPEGFGMVWRPVEGEVPNAFWRLMQFLVLGNLWVKDKPTKIERTDE